MQPAGATGTTARATARAARTALRQLPAETATVLRHLPTRTAATRTAARPARRGRSGRRQGPGVGRGGGLQAVGERRGQRDHEPGSHTRSGHPSERARRQSADEGSQHRRDSGDARQPDNQSEPGLEVRRPNEQHDRPAGSHADHRRQPDPTCHAGPPERDRGHANERRDPRQQGDRVVRVDDPVHKAENETGDEQPPAPEQRCRPQPICTRRARRSPTAAQPAR